MEIFLHTEQDLTVVEIEETSAVIDIAAHDGALVFLEDRDEPLVEDLTLVEQGVGDGAHIFAGKHHKIAATVWFNGVPERNDFAPSTRVGKVFDWACGHGQFDLSKVDKAEHTLSICGTDAPADMRKHVGEYAGPNGDVCFDLVPKHRFEG